jgi:hypothetical protein
MMFFERLQVLWIISKRGAAERGEHERDIMQQTRHQSICTPEGWL